MTEHTPGPWHVSEHSELPDREYEITTPDFSIADVGTAGDAMLIWAAPDLLAALEDCAEEIAAWRKTFPPGTAPADSKAFVTSKVLDNARAAIAKAKS